MPLRPLLVAVLATLLLVPAPAHAATATIGSTTIPDGASLGSSDNGSFFLANSDAPAMPYRVALGGSRVTSWSVNTTDASPGTPVDLLVLRPGSGTTYTVVGTDSQTLPATLPDSNVAAFTVAAPIVAEAGDRLALYLRTGSTVAPYWHGGATPPGSTLTAGNAATLPAAGTTVSEGSMGVSPPGYQLNIAATLEIPPIDLTMTQAASEPVIAGGIAQFTGLVHNGGTGTVPATVTDTVPAGLTIASAFSTNGPCAVTGQDVTCGTAPIAKDASAPVVVTVRTGAPGAFTNTMTAASALVDPNPADNAASAGLTVTAAPSPSPSVTPTPAPTQTGTGPFKCLVPPLKAVPFSIAKKVLKLVGCRTGKVRRVTSRKIRKGLVVRTSPTAPKTLALNARVGLFVSKGRPKRKR